MPNNKQHHGNDSDGSGHKSFHGDEYSEEARYTREWLWGCCNCGNHAAMTTSITVACPGCYHFRCKFCPMYSVKMRVDKPKILKGASFTSKNTSSVPGETQQSSTPDGMLGSLANCLWRLPQNLARLFTRVILIVFLAIGRHLPTVRPVFESKNTEAPPRESDSSCSGEAPPREPDSSFSGDIVSPNSGSTDSATNFDSENTESIDSESNSGELNEVVHFLDCRLVSMLNSEVDLTARLIPKIHDLMNEDRLRSVEESGFQHQNRPNYIEEKSSDGKQRPSGGSSSHTASQNMPSGSQAQKHGQGSGESDGRDDRENHKRQRHGSDENSGGGPGGRSNGYPIGNPSDDPDGSSRDDITRDPDGNPEGNPDDPGADPGHDPSLTEPLSTPNFACHFYKLDPIKYGPWTDKNYRQCPGSSITELRRIKYHLNAAHRLTPTLRRCPRCLCSFDSAAIFDDHCQAKMGCNPAKRASTCQDGITERQWEQIEHIFRKKGQKGVDDISRWYKIWRILFPGVKEPSTTRTERPGYITRSMHNIEKLKLKFKRRIEGDIKNGILQQDEKIQRYLHHFQQTLEECSASPGLVEPQPLGEDQGEEAGAPNTSQAYTPDNSHLSLINTGYFQPQDAETETHSLIRNELTKNFCQQIGSAMDLNPTQAQFHSPLSGSTLGHNDELTVELNIASKNAYPNQSWENSLDFESAKDLEPIAPSYRDREGNETHGFNLEPGPFEIDYFMGDHLFAGLLQFENKNPEEIGQ